MMQRKKLPPPPPELGVLMLDVRQVAATLNMGVSTVWKCVARDPRFPKPVAISPRVKRWRASEIKQWAETFQPA